MGKALVVLVMFGMVGCIHRSVQGTGPNAPKNKAPLAGTAGQTGQGPSFQQEGLAESDLGGEGYEGTSVANEFPVIYFGYDEALLTEEARAQLDALAAKLKEQASLRLQIEGHCDERGSTEYNLALGERRAAAVKRYLEMLGVPGSQLDTISYGEERPAVEGHDESAWAKNRRAEFVPQKLSH